MNCVNTELHHAATACSRVWGACLVRRARQTVWILFPTEGQLATITAQCDEEDYGTLGKALDKIIASVTKT